MQKKNSELFSSILYIVIGVLLASFPRDFINIAMTVAGIVFLVSGVLEIVKNNVSGGVISLIIGASILILGLTLVGIVLLVFGVLIALKGLVALLNALKKQRTSVSDVLYPAITIALGFIIAIGNWVPFLIIIGGILLTVDGVLGLINELKR